MERNQTILIVEDLEDDLFLLRRALTRSGINNPVVSVSNGEQAIRYLQGNDIFSDRAQFPFPGVIFLDLKLPCANGFTVLEWLQRNRPALVVPVIVLTSSTHETDVRQAYALGASAYLVKPSSHADLQEMMKSTYAFWSYCRVPAPDSISPNELAMQH